MGIVAAQDADDGSATTNIGPGHEMDGRESKVVIKEGDSLANKPCPMCGSVKWWWRDENICSKCEGKLTKEIAAESFSQRVTTEGRVLCDTYIGPVSYTTVTTIVKAAFLAGACYAEKEALNLLADRVHQANDKWWKNLQTGASIDRNVGELLMLTVSELAEAMEGHRKNLNDDKLPHRKMFEVELADALIRILDMAGGLGLDLGGAFEEKMVFNATREDHKAEARRGANGKKY